MALLSQRLIGGGLNCLQSLQSHPCLPAACPLPLDTLVLPLLCLNTKAQPPRLPLSLYADLVSLEHRAHP